MLAHWVNTTAISLSTRHTKHHDKHLMCLSPVQVTSHCGVKSECTRKSNVPRKVTWVKKMNCFLDWTANHWPASDLIPDWPGSFSLGGFAGRILRKFCVLYSLVRKHSPTSKLQPSASSGAPRWWLGQRCQTHSGSERGLIRTHFIPCLAWHMDRIDVTSMAKSWPGVFLHWGLPPKSPQPDICPGNLFWSYFLKKIFISELKCCSNIINNCLKDEIKTHECEIDKNRKMPIFS